MVALWGSGMSRYLFWVLFLLTRWIKMGMLARLGQRPVGSCTSFLGFGKEMHVGPLLMGGIFYEM